jgi:hypothetical protein
MLDDQLVLRLLGRLSNWLQRPAVDLEVFIVNTVKSVADAQDGLSMAPGKGGLGSASHRCPHLGCPQSYENHLALR